MAVFKFDNINIAGISCAVPRKIVKTSETKALTQEEVEQFIKGTGVVQHHVCNKNQTTSDLCYVAAKRLIEEKGLSGKDFDALIFLTQSPDYFQPATAHILHLRLGLSEECMAFDINLGCSGYCYGLNLAASLLQNPNFKRVLFCCGEVERPNPLIPEKDHLLFGNAGTATILEKGENSFSALLRSTGKNYDCLIIPGGNTRNPIVETKTYFEDTYPRMDGETVFSFSISKVPKAFKDFFDAFNKSMDDYDYCVFHQANMLILNYLAKKLKLGKNKMPISLDRYGNTSSASIPLTICDLKESLAANDTINIIASGFGIGLSWGIVSFKVKSSDIYPIILTDDYFEEAYRG